MDVISTAERTAQKDHRCVACEAWLNSGYALVDCQNDDQREVVKAAEADGWKIRKGQAYLSQTQSDGGEIYTVRCRPDMNDLCHALDLYLE